MMIENDFFFNLNFLDYYCNGLAQTYNYKLETFWQVYGHFGNTQAGSLPAKHKSKYEICLRSLTAKNICSIKMKDRYGDH